MPERTDQDRDAEFLGEVIRRGLATEAQVEECRRLRAVAAEIGVAPSMEEVLVRKGILTPDRAAEVRRSLASLRVGKYEILERIGEGGWGVVYRAHQTNLGREVALKVLSRRAGDRPEHLDRFLREARVAVTLNHVNIVRGLDFGFADGYHYFAMELVEGETLLKTIQREGRFTEKKALDVAHQIARALEHAQTFQVVHRDIKPENILITPMGVAKLCDLGLAHPSIEGVETRQGGHVLGTALYMAPEQIRGKELDFRADVYSLGATLFQMLTGVAPHTGASVQEIIRKHLDEPPPNPRDRVLEVSSSTAAIVVKMLAKDPAERYQTLESLAEDLQSVLDGRPPVHTIQIGGRRPGPATTAAAGAAVAEAAAQRRSSAGGAPGPRPRARALAPILVSAAGLIVLGGAAFFFLRGKEPPPPPPPPVDGGTKKGGGEAVDLGRLRSAREEAGGRALAEAEGFAGEHEGAAKEVVEKFRKVVREHEGTRAAGQARARAEEMEKAWWGGVRREYASREERAARALAEGRLGAALGEWATVPDEWAGTDAGEKAGARRREIEELAEKRTAEAEGLARSAVAGDPAGVAAARDALTAVGGCGIEKFAARARAARERLDRTLEDRDRRLQAAEAAWERVAGEAILAAPAGTKVVEEVLAKDAAALEPVEGKVEALRGYLAEMGLFVDAARRAFGKAVAAGEKVRLRTPGRPGGAVSGRAAGVKPEGFEIARGPAADLVPLVEIAPEDVAALAWSEIGSGGPKDHRGAVLYYLSRGAFAQADQALQALAVVDPSADSALVPALAGSTRAAARARADAALREADLFRMQKRPVEAKAAFARAVSLCEGYSRPLWKMGAFLLESEKDVDAALAVLDGAAALLPEDPEAWYWIAEARRRKGRGPEAVEAFARFLAQAPQDSPLRATAKSAEEEIRKALRDSQARAAREEAGRAFRREKWDEAEELWKRVLDLLPGDAEALYFHGKSCLQQGRNLDAYLDLRASLAGAKSGARVDDARKAVKDLEQRLGDSPAAARSHQEGVSLFGQGKWREAAAAYGRALETAPLRLESYYGRAESLRQSWMAERNTADLAAAEADLRVALRLNKQYAPALCGLAAVLYEREDWAKAAEVAAKAMEKDRGSSVVCEVLASALLKLDRPLEAEEAAGEGYRREARPILLLLRAEARARQRKTKEARADLDLVDDKHELSPGERQYRAQVLGMVIEAERGQ